MAREHFVIPLSLNGSGLTVAISDQPTPELLRLLGADHAASGSSRCWRPNRRSVSPSTTTTGPPVGSTTWCKRSKRSRNPASAHHETRPFGDPDDCRQCTGRPGRRSRSDPGHARPGVRRPVEPSEQGVRVRYRIDGALKEVLTLPTSMAVGLISRIKIMAGMNIVERRRPQDGQLRTRDRWTRSRVASPPSPPSGVRSASCASSTAAASLLRLSDLGMPQRRRPRIPVSSVRRSAWSCCAGPPGAARRRRCTQRSPRSATRAECDDHRGSRGIRLPRDQPDSNQRAGGLTFATGLDSILRQDPDVILVGEIRDVETARVAVQSP